MKLFWRKGPASESVVELKLLNETNDRTLDDLKSIHSISSSPAGKSLNSSRVVQCHSKNAVLHLMWFLKPQMSFDVRFCSSDLPAQAPLKN